MSAILKPDSAPGRDLKLVEDTLEEGAKKEWTDRLLMLQQVGLQNEIAESPNDVVKENMINLLEDGIEQTNSWRELAYSRYASPKLEWDAHWAGAFIERALKTLSMEMLGLSSPD